MSNQLQKGTVFADGQVVNAALLNNLVDLATALEGIISAQGALTPAATSDQVLIMRPGSPNTLKRAAVSTLPSGVTSVGFTANPTSAFLVTNPSPGGPAVAVTLDLRTQPPNRVMASPADPAAANAAPTPRALVPADMTLATRLISVANIDWSLGNVFDKTLTGPITFSFSNVLDGQTIVVRVKQTGAGHATVAWDPGLLTLVWCDGVTPVLTTVPNGYGIYVFTAVKAGSVTQIHGFLEQHTPAGDAQAANTVLAGPLSGSAAVPTFRALTPADVPPTFTDVSVHIIDCTLDNVFRKTHTVGTGTDTLYLNNGAPGQQITVYLIQHATPFNRLVTWDTQDSGGIVRWPTGMDHTMTIGSDGRTDIAHFLCMGSGLYYGTYWKDFTP